MNRDVQACLDQVTSGVRRRDADTLLAMMSRISGQPPRMWTPTIIGFGHYHYKYASGREGDGPAASFSPRKAATTIYLPDGTGAYAEQLGRLGAHTVSVGCLYLKDLQQVDLAVLEEIVAESYRVLSDGTYTHRATDHR
jgi:hypothetical protein